MKSWTSLHPPSLNKIRTTEDAISASLKQDFLFHINTTYPPIIISSYITLQLHLLYINDFPDDVIYNIAVYADDTTLYSKCDQASDLWQQLELASEFEPDL